MPSQAASQGWGVGVELGGGGVGVAHLGQGSGLI